MCYATAVWEHKDERRQGHKPSTAYARGSCPMLHQARMLPAPSVANEPQARPVPMLTLFSLTRLAVSVLYASVLAHLCSVNVDATGAMAMDAVYPQCPTLPPLPVARCRCGDEHGLGAPSTTHHLGPPRPSARSLDSTG